MLSIVPGNFSSLVSVEMRDVLANPYMTGLWTINLLYLVDVHVATVGYILTLKPLDAHIRTANPYGMAWVAARSEEHTSELQSLMRISYAVFCLKKKKKHTR